MDEYEPTVNPPERKYILFDEYLDLCIPKTDETRRGRAGTAAWASILLLGVALPLQHAGTGCGGDDDGDDDDDKKFDEEESLLS